MGERAKVRRQLSGRIGVTFNPTPPRVILSRPLLDPMSTRPSARDLDEADDRPHVHAPLLPLEPQQQPQQQEQVLSPSSEQRTLVGHAAAGETSRGDEDYLVEAMPPNRHNSEGTKAPPGSTIDIAGGGDGITGGFGRMVASKSVQIDAIPGRLLLHPKLQSRLEEEPDRFREGPIARRLSDTPPWFRTGEAAPSDPNAVQSKRGSGKERETAVPDSDRHAGGADADAEAEAPARTDPVSEKNAEPAGANEGAVHAGKAAKEAPANEEDATTTTAMRAQEKRAKSSMGGALALLPPREVWEKKIDFLLSVIGFAVDFANMYTFVLLTSPLLWC